jgi:hypothetical protein
MSWAALATRSGLSSTKRAPHGFCCSSKPSTSRPMSSGVGLEVHAGKTLPEIILADADWFFWAFNKDVFKGRLSRRAPQPH